MAQLCQAGVMDLDKWLGEYLSPSPLSSETQETAFGSILSPLSRRSRERESNFQPDELSEISVPQKYLGKTPQS